MVDLETAEPAAWGSENRRSGSVIRGVVRAARPKQWAKNVLLFAAPGAAGVLTDTAVLGRVFIAAAAFSLVASGTYLVNDVCDAAADRRHPVKQTRPVASGLVPVSLALAMAVVLGGAGLGVSALLGWRFALVLTVYVVSTLSYSFGLKHVAIVDLALVASGFILRAVGGGVAADVPVSKWFLIVASFGSLFIVAGKRHAEFHELGETRHEVRPTLGVYPIAYLRYVWMLSSGVAIMAYCLWAFEMADLRSGPVWYELSVVPFVLALLRYAFLLESGHGGAPEDVLMSDRALQVLGVVWVAVFGVAVHLGN